MCNDNELLRLIIIFWLFKVLKILDLSMRTDNSLCSISGKIIVGKKVYLTQLIVNEAITWEGSVKIECHHICSSELCPLAGNSYLTTLTFVIGVGKLMLVTWREVENRQRRIDTAIWSKFGSDSKSGQIDSSRILCLLRKEIWNLN